MAKRKSDNTKEKLPSLLMRKHVATFGSQWRYEEWCEKNGFRTGVDKTLVEISNEQAFRRTSFGVEKRQTVEVSKRGEIVQSRGKFNRLPTSSEFEILKKWASYAGLRIAPYVSYQ